MVKVKKTESRFIKIVYFDESSAIDYINVSDGGLISKTQEQQSHSSEKTVENFGTGIDGKFSFFKLLKANANVDINAEMLQYGQNIVKSTITNSILTDYIKKAKDDEHVKKFNGFLLNPIPNSLTYWKMYTPYTKLFQDKFSDKISPEIDITKLDGVIDSVKGYYELFAQNTSEKYILRFNSQSFRNNYKISNLMNMNLVYYGIHVGECEKEQYSIENEFKFDEHNLTISEIKGTTDNNNKIQIYDIVLAGVEVVNEKSKS